MSSFVRRMQPDETLVPIVQGSLVPWMRYSVSLLATPEVHGPCSERIIGTAFHADAALQLHHVLAQLWLARQHFRRRIPIGPFLLAMDCRTPRPDKAFRADPNAIADGLSGVVDQVEKMTARIDDDRSRPLVRRVGDDLAGEGGIGPSRLFPQPLSKHRHWSSHLRRLSLPAVRRLPFPHDPRLPARQSREPEPDLHKDILNQKGATGTTLRLPA